MAIRDQELSHEHHLAIYERLGNLTGDPQRDAYWNRQAEYMHALSVSDAIRDVSLQAVISSQRIVNSEANLHLRFGVARRTKFIWLSLRRLLRLIPPEREDPLPGDAVDEAATDLNAIYINIRGTLDNFAWCLLNLFGEEKTRRLPPATVHLFGQDFLRDLDLSEEAAFLGEFKKWNRELKERRDPAAHRIPLSVVPAVLDAAAQEEYARIAAEHHKAMSAAIEAVGDGVNKQELFEKVGLVHDHLEQVGTFIPVFGHHPVDGYMRIYPTVTQDIGKLVRITRGLTAIISKRLEE